MADEKHESKRNCNPRQKWLPVAAILLLIFLAVGFSVQYISFVSQTIYQESTSHLQELLHKIPLTSKCRILMQNLYTPIKFAVYLRILTDSSKIWPYFRHVSSSKGMTRR